MIISPPFLPSRSKEPEQEWLDKAMQMCEQEYGSFPAGHTFEWHGGIHLMAPKNSNGTPLPVRAIADGTVIFSRKRTLEASPDAPLNYNAGYTSDAAVVIRHDTEIGADSKNKATRVVFYSLYLHLASIHPSIIKGKSICRKAEIGQAGYIYGEPNMMHFEICCDEKNAAHLIGRTTGNLSTMKNGRIDAIFGEIYFHLPAGTPIYKQNPMNAYSTPAETVQPSKYKSNSKILNFANSQQSQATTPNPAHTTSSEWIIGIKYQGDDTTATQTGGAIIKTYSIDGNFEGNPTFEPDAEYSLYSNAKAISLAHPSKPTPSISAIYDLLRFGRSIEILNLSPTNIPYWKKIDCPDGQGWVNLNASENHKFSDADTPQWKGWKIITDASGADSRCDSPTLQDMFHRDTVQSSMDKQKIKRKLAYTICKFPSEWDEETVDKRWSWIKEKSSRNHSPLSQENYTKLTEHLRALCIPAPEVLSAQWHFNPKAFIEHYRKCNWLSTAELDRIYPDALYPTSALSKIGISPSTIKARYQISINKITEKYFILGSTRRTHFFGQGAVESMFMALMIEGEASFSKNPLHASFAPETNGFYNPSNPSYLKYLEGKLGNIEKGDGVKFRGRGMKQLTGRENYSKYWVYRGWLGSDSFKSPWWNPARVDRAPKISNPQRLSTDSYSAIDAGGWYWEAGSAANHFRSINTAIANHEFNREAIERVTRAINGGLNGIADRISQTLRIKAILSDEA